MRRERLQFSSPRPSRQFVGLKQSNSLPIGKAADVLSSESEELVEHFGARPHLLPVRFVKTVLIVLLALLWAAASNHCKLEQIPEWEFLACCDHENTAPHQDDDCETDGCAMLENQLYKTETAQVSAAAPTLLFTISLSPLWAELSTPQTVSHVLPDAAPAVLPRIWQFSYRTALPPRAPSLLS